MDSLHVRVPVADLDLATDLLWQCGVVGIEERSNPGTPDDGFLELVAGPGDDGESADFWHRVTAALGDRWSWHRRPTDADAVADAWRPFARVVEIGATLICPRWLDPPTDHPDVLLLEPGRAWGHGSHPSTVLAAELLLDTLARPGPPGRQEARVLDVGCGSGVLSLVSARRGASVTGFDIDAEALRVTSSNAALNDLDERIEVTSSSLAVDVLAPFDLVVANLGIRAITEVAEQLARWVRPRGCLILSGLLGTQIAGILALPAWPRWQIVDERDDGQWSALRLQAT